MVVTELTNAMNFIPNLPNAYSSCGEPETLKISVYKNLLAFSLTFFLIHLYKLAICNALSRGNFFPYFSFGNENKCSSKVGDRWENIHNLLSHHVGKQMSIDISKSGLPHSKILIDTCIDMQRHASCECLILVISMAHPMCRARVALRILPNTSVQAPTTPIKTYLSSPRKWIFVTLILPPEP